MIITSFTR